MSEMPGQALATVRARFRRPGVSHETPGWAGQAGTPTGAWKAAARYPHRARYPHCEDIDEHS